MSHILIGRAITKASVNKSERQPKVLPDKRARTRAAILDATFEVIGHEFGRWARVEQITEVAQIARPTFYTYFSSMEELYAALSFELSHDFNNAVIASQTFKEPAEITSFSVRSYLAKAASDHQWGWGMLNLSCGAPLFGAETTAAATMNLQLGIDRGIFKLADVRVGRDMTLGTVLAAMKTLMTEPCPPDYPEVIARHILISLGVTAKRADKIVQMPIPDINALMEARFQ